MRKSTSRIIAALFAFWLAGHSVLTLGGPSGRLSRTDLLSYRDAQGNIRPVRSPADWLERREEIVRGMREIMGPMPGEERRSPLDLVTQEEVDCGTYVRRWIHYTPEPGSRVPAYLLVPKQALIGPPAAAVLCLHPTEHQLGNKVVVGLGGKPNRAYAAELAERGYVTIAPAYPQLADYHPDLKALGYRSGTMKAVWDNVRALDLLESLPFVKRGGFGSIGHSLGGHNSVYTAVFDTRIRAVVTSCGFDSFLHYMDGDIRGWTSERYMPSLLGYRDRLEEIPFDFHELIASLAPRRIFISAPLGDGNFKWRSVDEIVKAAAEIYRLHGVPENLHVEHPDCGHDFPDDVRLRAYEFLDGALRQE